MHVVKSWSDIAHQGHQEEWDLEDIFLNEVEASDNLIVPGNMIQAEDQGYKPEKNFDADDLPRCQLSDCRAVWYFERFVQAYGNGYDEADGQTSQHRDSSLSVVVGCKEGWVLESTVGLLAVSISVRDDECCF